ncbi:MAG: hypothetical protein JWO56_1045 [Acidobacteria bacterium]|nr:hypothetical protein [Acidobacteriota bacterium]
MTEQKRELTNRDRWLMLSLWLGPLAALADLTVSYSLVPEACDRGTKLILHAVALAFLLIALSSAFLARHYYKQFARAEGSSVLWMERTRWFALVAMLLCFASAIVIVAMEVPNLILRSCE